MNVLFDAWWFAGIDKKNLMNRKIFMRNFFFLDYAKKVRERNVYVCIEYSAMSSNGVCILLTNIQTTTRNNS